MSHKTLLFDVTSIVPYYLFGHATGVGRSTMELVKELNKLSRSDLPFDLILYSQNIKGIGVRNLKTPFRKLHFYVPKRKPFTNIINTFRLKEKWSRCDLMHIPHNTDKWENIHKTIYTIHDLIVYRYPEMWGLTDADRKEQKYIADNCKAIVTCSESSRQDIIHFWGCPPEKVTVIPWGVNRDVFHHDEGSIDNINGLGKDFFFSSSCNHPRKQPGLILQAFEKYLNEGGKAQLVLLSPSLEDIKNYQYLIDSQKLILVSGIDDTTLVRLYSQAKATILASLYEGFGLPVLESLACGTQVICAYNSSLIEAGGTVVDYLKELTPECLTDAMLKYDDISKCDTLDNDAVEAHLSNFTWKKCVDSYIDFWNIQLNTQSCYSN